MAPFSRGKRGLFGMPMPDMTNSYAPVEQPAPEFEKPSTLQSIAGVLGDSLQIAGGGQASFAPALQMRRAMFDKAQLAQAAEARDFANFRQRYDYERANPKTDQATALQRNYEYLKGIDRKLAESFLQGEANKPQWVTADNGDGTKTVIPIYPGMASGGNTGPPPPPASGLPQGYTVRKKGGSTPSASGGFR